MILLRKCGDDFGEDILSGGSAVDIPERKPRLAEVPYYPVELAVTRKDESERVGFASYCSSCRSLSLFNVAPSPCYRVTRANARALIGCAVKHAVPLNMPSHLLAHTA